MDNNTKFQGLYFIYDVNDMLIYVGISSNIEKRMYSHFGNSLFRAISSNIPEGEADRFEYLKVDDISYLRYLEKECIIIYDPKYNYSINRSDIELIKIKDSDVAKELEKIRF